MQRETLLLPKLAPATRLPIPNITHLGHVHESGHAFVAYPRIPGVELTRERLDSLALPSQDQAARDLSGFLADLHSFDLGLENVPVVPRCSYPFCRTEDGILEGDANYHYTQALKRLLSYPVLDDETRIYCTRIVERLLSEKDDRQTLVHGDLSQDHVLFDPESGRITGVIDFSDAIITTPLLDMTYLYHAYGREFFKLLVSYYPTEDRQRTTVQVRLLHGWYITLRLLWALDHDYQQGVETNMRLLAMFQREY